MRKSLLLTVPLLLFPMSCLTLGLGDIQVNSGLNEPLDARVNLTSATERDLESIDIKMASDRDYNRADIDKVDILRQINFKVKADGADNYVHITSNSILREPFVNFLIDIQWYSGRLLREYTLLLDPPEVAREKIPASVEKSEPITNKQVVKAAESSAPTMIAPANKIETKLVAEGSSLSYGPTFEHDTLWAVAEKMRPNPTVSMNQMMIALQMENPEAFNQRNINGLMAGYTLEIDDVNSLKSISADEAEELVQLQEDQWKKILADSKYAAEHLDKKTKQSIKSSVKNTPNTKQKKSQSSLELLSVEEGERVATNSSKASDKAVAKLTAKLALAEEILQSKTQENEELHRRVSVLESLLEKRLNLVNLKGESLALLQQREKQSVQAENFDTTDEVEQVEKEEQQEQQEQQAVAQEEDTEVIKVAETVKTAETEATQEPESKKEAEEKETVSSTPVPVAADNAGKVSMVDNLLSLLMDYLYAVLGIVALLIVWILSKFVGNKKKDDGFQESILNSSAAVSDFNQSDSNSDADFDQSSSVLDDETSFLSDFSTSELDSLQPDMEENDPLSEADVLIVYQRFDEAKKLLNGLIKKEPQQIDAQMKLLEVYHESKDEDGFKKQSAIVKGLLLASGVSLLDDENWAKAEHFAKSFDLDLESIESEEPTYDLTEQKDEPEKEQADDDSSDENEAAELADDEIDVDDLERQLNAFEEMLGDDFDDGENDIADLDTTTDAESNEFNLDDLSADLEESVSEVASLDDEFSQSTEELDEVTTELGDGSTELDDSSNDLSLDDELATNDDMSFDLDEKSTTDSHDEFEIDMDDFSDDNETTEANEESTELSLDDDASDDYEIDMDDLSLDDNETSEASDESTELSLEEDDDASDDYEIDMDDLSLDDNETSEASDESTELSLEDDGDASNDYEIDMDDFSDDNETTEDNIELSLEDDDSDDIDMDELSFDEAEISNIDESDNNDLELSRADTDTNDELELELDLDNEEVDTLGDTESSLDDKDSADDDSDIDFDDVSQKDSPELDDITNDLESLSADLNDADADDIDPLGSKLDLARAYIDMDDKQTAIDILSEVMEKGDEAQIAEAKKLFNLAK